MNLLNPLLLWPTCSALMMRDSEVSFIFKKSCLAPQSEMKLAVVMVVEIVQLILGEIDLQPDGEVIL